MKYLAMAGMLFAGAAQATSIESVTLLRDANGEPGAEVEMFAPSDHVKHFSVKLDEMKLGQHEFLVEFWADETTTDKNTKITEFTTSGLIANTVTAQVSLPRDWPMGWYHIEVKMDGQSLGKHRYIVSKPWEQQKVVSWMLYQDDGKGGEGAQVTAFSVTDHHQHFEMQTDGYLKRKAKVRIVYTALDSNEQVQAVDFEVPANPAIFNILTSDIELPQDWPAGNYQIALYDGKRLLGKHQYRIE